MGLDMYLEKEIYIGARYKHRKIEGIIELTTEGKPIDINTKKVSTITESVAYWRKANHIHKWFVDNVQDGKDECERSWVARTDLLKLRDICKEVLENKDKAEKLLPTEDGFFFGGTQYDEYYFEDLKDTIEMLKDIPEEADPWIDYYYQSSW